MKIEVSDVLQVNFSQWAGGWRIDEGVQGHHEGLLDGVLVGLGEGGVEWKEGSKHVAELAVGLRHRVVPDQDQSTEEHVWFTKATSSFDKGP